MQQNAQQGSYTQSIQSGGYIIEDDAPAAGQTFKLAGGKWLGDVKKAEKNEGYQGVTPPSRAAEQGDPLAGDLVNDHELRVLASGFAGDDGAGRDAESKMPASRTMRRVCGVG